MLFFASNLTDKPILRQSVASKRLEEVELPTGMLSDCPILNQNGVITQLSDLTLEFVKSPFIISSFTLSVKKT